MNLSRLFTGFSVFVSVTVFPFLYHLVQGFRPKYKQVLHLVSNVVFGLIINMFSPYPPVATNVSDWFSVKVLEIRAWKLSVLTVMSYVLIEIDPNAPLIEKIPSGNNNPKQPGEQSAIEKSS